MAFSAYDYLREEEERRRRALLMNAQDPVPVQEPDVTTATRPRRVFEQPPSTPTAGRPRYADPITYDTSGMPERRANNYGAEPLDTSIKYRDALENWHPSTGDRSLRNVGAGAGYGALTAAQANPGSPEAMIGGGIAGLLSTLFKPSSKNWMRRGIALGQADADVARQLKTAGEQAKLRQAEISPYFREVGLNQGQQRIDNARSKMEQDRLLAHRRALASVFNSYPEFDPEDPKNAAIVSAMSAVGLPVTKKTRGSLLQLVQGTDENGNATFSVVHKPTATATQVTGEGLPAKTEQEFGREASASRARMTQEGADRRARMAQEGADRRASSRTGRSGVTVDKAAQRRAAKLVGDIEQSRSFMTDADERLKANPKDENARTDRRNAQLMGERAAGELNALQAGYEAGAGTGGYPYYKKQEQQQEDPKVRAYADKFFGGNYDAAVEAIRKQRGQ